MRPDDREPIGVLGGSFDPIHAAHMQFARAALQELDARQILFIPAGQAWQKGPASAAVHRERMVELAIGAEPRFALDRRELGRPGPSYTVDTLRELRSALGVQRPLLLLVGSDQFEHLDTWHRWEELIGLAHLGVASRPGFEAPLAPALARLRERHLGSPAEARARAAGVLLPIEMHPMDCSSTRIRELVRESTPAADAALSGLLDPAVLAYIRQHRLYS